MHKKNTIGLALGFLSAIIGFYLFFSGYREMNNSGTMAKIKHKITGSHSPATRNYMIGGVIFVVVGIGLAYFSRARKQH